jgi:hypothetical protein
LDVTLRDAFAAVYGLHDDRGYAFYAGLHGLPRSLRSLRAPASNRLQASDPRVLGTHNTQI